MWETCHVILKTLIVHSHLTSVGASSLISLVLVLFLGEKALEKM